MTAKNLLSKLPAELVDTLMTIRDSISRDQWAIGEIDSLLCARLDDYPLFDETGEPYTHEDIHRLIGETVGVRARRVRGCAAVYRAYSDAQRKEYRELPFSNFEFALCHPVLTLDILETSKKSDVRYETAVVDRQADRWEVRTTIRTPDGDLSSLSVYPRDNAYTITEKPVKNFAADFKKLRHLFSDVVSCDTSLYDQLRKEMGEQGMVCSWVGLPGLQSYVGIMDLETITYGYHDHPDLFAELIDPRQLPEPIQPAERAARRVRLGRLLAAAGVDAYLCEGGPTMTYTTPACWKWEAGFSNQAFTLMRPPGTPCGWTKDGKRFRPATVCRTCTKDRWCL